MTSKNKAVAVCVCARVPMPLSLSPSLSLFLSSSFLKYRWPTTFYSLFFYLKHKKVRRKHDDSGSIHINMCFLLPFLSLLNFFFVNSLFSRFDDNSRRYHYTCTVWPLLSPVGDRVEKNKRRKRIPGELDISCRTHERTNERKKWTLL
jgi:hypothetical protein